MLMIMSIRKISFLAFLYFRNQSVFSLQWLRIEVVITFKLWYTQILITDAPICRYIEHVDVEDVLCAFTSSSVNKDFIDTRPRPTRFHWLEPLWQTTSVCNKRILFTAKRVKNHHIGKRYILMFVNSVGLYCTWNIGVPLSPTSQWGDDGTCHLFDDIIQHLLSA
jgi:hypothetical protein